MATKVVCPECEITVELTEPTPESPSHKGTCPKCSLNLGAIYTKHRHELAYKRFVEKQSPPPAPAPPKKDADGDDDPFNFTGKRK